MSFGKGGGGVYACLEVKKDLCSERTLFGRGSGQQKVESIFLRGDTRKNLACNRHSVSACKKKRLLQIVPSSGVVTFSTAVLFVAHFWQPERVV